MVTIPNFLSLLRLPLALVFLKPNITLRAVSLVLAMITDGLDGFLARRYKLSSKVGTLLDPLMDRFFVFFLIGVFLHEGQMQPWEVATLLCRDVAVILFGFYLIISNRLSTYRFRAIWCGKATTFLQFLVFMAIILQVSIPPGFFGCFVLLGVLALIELYISRESNPAAPHIN